VHVLAVCSVCMVRCFGKQYKVPPITASLVRIREQEHELFRGTGSRPDLDPLQVRQVGPFDSEFHMRPFRRRRTRQIWPMERCITVAFFTRGSW
jgi:hypothetical protein